MLVVSAAPTSRAEAAEAADYADYADHADYADYADSRRTWGPCRSSWSARSKTVRSAQAPLDWCAHRTRQVQFRPVSASGLR
ncbi:MAG: hypothetical protein OXB92_08590 [Acidimicrobiaceae bacterium]|nr:hypothetical protein [Acidimicrobiaceae bacterium]